MKLIKIKKINLIVKIKIIIIQILTIYLFKIVIIINNNNCYSDYDNNNLKSNIINNNNNLDNKLYVYKNIYMMLILIINYFINL